MRIRLFQRWVRFNLVGILGVGIQLATLSVLTNTIGFHYLTATFLAVEAAIVHNFIWHQAWTWRSFGFFQKSGSLNRLARFHITNGMLSIFGNLLIMKGLVDYGHLPILVSNLAAIISCSMVNFVLSEFFVFRR